MIPDYTKQDLGDYQNPLYGGNPYQPPRIEQRHRVLNAAHVKFIGLWAKTHGIPWRTNPIITLACRFISPKYDMIGFEPYPFGIS
jgi:hypothetical protein